MSKSRHDQIAENIAKKLGVQYKKHRGIDIVTPNRAIEVETTKSGIYHGINQVKRSSKARYIATNDKNLRTALAVTKGTGIGVINSKGDIIKRARRKT